MLSVATAADLLTRATDMARLRAIARAIGFAGPVEELSRGLCERLALPREVVSAGVIEGEGALRMLLVELAPATPWRETLSAVATALRAVSPHALWMVLGCVRGGAAVFLAVWAAPDGQQQMRALSVDRQHVYASDAETLCALAACCDGPDLLVHARWAEVLGRDALTRRFYMALRETIRGLSRELPRTVDRSAAESLALLNVSRLLFLAFLQAKGWLDGDHGFLQNCYDAAIRDGGRVHARMLEPLFFGTLNTRPTKRQPRARAFGRIPYLNGGLFSRALLERRWRTARFSDEALGHVVGGLLARYRFTPREEAADWSDAAVDPVILGRAFESLMDQGERKATGTYYTPPAVVARATRLALERALVGGDVVGNVVSAALNSENLPAPLAASLLQRVRTCRVLDPACGSGAFLIHALRVLAELRVRFGRETHAEAWRATLTRSIFGVDVNPTAVWLCELRLWLSLAVECVVSDPLEVPPLPNLDHNIRVGDSLAGPPFEGAAGGPRVGAMLARLRERYARAEGRRKQTLARALAGAERRAALSLVEAGLAALQARRRDVIAAVRSHDLFGERRPGARSSEELRRLKRETQALREERTRIAAGGALAFAFPVQFADVAARGGFDVVVGNPPWVRPHRLSRSSRAALRARFAVCRTARRWDAGGPGGTHPFGAQVDLAAPFVERSLELLRPGGALALLVPSKLWSSLAGAGLRRLSLTAAELLSLEDFTTGAQLFQAAAYPSLLALAKPAGERRKAGTVRVVIHRREARLQWEMEHAELRLGHDLSAPWLLVPPQVRNAFDRVSAAGQPLNTSRFGPPRLGVKTGCNGAFIVRVTSCGNTLAEVCSGERHGWVEHYMLRPALRGEAVRPWRAIAGRTAEPAEGDGDYVIWTHDEADRPLRRLPVQTAAWLAQWRRELARRVDARPGGAWWQLFRTPAARNDRHRVVWSDIGRVPRASVLEPGDPTVPLNTCYVVFADEPDAWALAALLNGPLASAWLTVLAEPARGAYRRFFAWTVGSLPIPGDESAFRAALAPLGRAGCRGREPSQQQLLDAALAAYGLRRRDVAALLEWRDV